LPFLLLAAVGWSSPASAQQQEKRIALVVGNGAYAKAPLATAANDAGLIAQTLQAAGFDVVGARDLDGDTLRKSFRDFIQKAQSSGPGTVAMIYLAGYGVQLAGENYFIPVDSNIARDTDIPTEGLRVSDYLRQLAALPLKANVVVLDAARRQPFVEGGQGIASGLALVEPEPNMLIAFNAAPGTVAPEEPGPYGAYAQSLAEMIRTGGLSLPEVFERVRLRVNETSKGAQVPWDAQKIGASFAFFERGPDAPPPQAAPDQVAAIRDKPIRDLGAQDAYAAALERDTLPAYEEFLAAYPDDPMAKRVRAILAARREAITWRRTYRADTPEAYWSYLRRYPRGPHAADARRRLAILTAPLEPPPSFAMLDYDVPPPPPEEVVYVDRPVLMFADPDFGFAPPPPPPVYYLPPPPPDFIVLAPPLAVVGLFVLPQPVFVPIPVFVRPPRYIAPPPNNIIYANIHNTTVINTVINRPPPAPPTLAPGSPPAPLAGRPPGVGPAMPPAAVQRASLIQQGKAPLPPSALINPTVKGTTPPVTPANVAPSVTPQGQTKLPAANALPVPGSSGTPPAPTGAGAPNTRIAPTATAPATTVLPGRSNLPVVNAPAGATAPGGPPSTLPPKPPVATIAPGAGTGTGTGTGTGAGTGAGSGPAGKPIGVVSPPAAVIGKPAVPTVKPVTPSAVQAARPVSPPPQVVRPPPPPQITARPVPPAPARVVAPPPSRPPPPVAVARPAPPPPPVVRAPPPPPPVARIAPPPPPPVARMAPPPPPPPPVARMAPPPPPRPAAPPPPAPHKCPPNQKC
jgi:uncharacterized caspase-like protein